MRTPESMLFQKHGQSTEESFQPMSTANFKTKTQNQKGGDGKERGCRVKVT